MGKGERVKRRRRERKNKRAHMEMVDWALVRRGFDEVRLKGPMEDVDDVAEEAAEAATGSGGG